MLEGDMLTPKCTLSSSIMILAAGFGTRLRPVTLNIPKPLVSINGETLLDYHLTCARKFGFELAIINTHYLSHMIEDHLKDAPLPCTLSHERTVLDTGGGIKKALQHFLLPFVSVNSDTYTMADLPEIIEEMQDHFDSERMDALLLVVPLCNVMGYEKSGDFFLHDQTDQVSELVFRKYSPASPYVFVGVQILHPRLFDHSPKTPSFPIATLWKNAQRQGRLFGYKHRDSIWFDTGNLNGLELARSFRSITQLKML